MNSARRKNRNQFFLKNFLLTLIVLMSCLTGFLLGVGSHWYYENVYLLDGHPIIGVSDVLPSAPNRDVNSLQDDGFYLVQNTRYIKLPEIVNDSNIDFSVIPISVDTSPLFAVKGSSFPMGSLRLLGYIAGVGVDVTFSQSGAVINTVFANSPAQIAGLQPGDVVVSVDDRQATLTATSYTPGKLDLFGPMKESVSLSVVRGTSNFIVQLPRTYRETVGGTPRTVNFDIEPAGEYVLLKVTQSLKPGLYVFEFSLIDVFSFWASSSFNPTPTPTQPPIPLPVQKWLFVVE
jgi:hypothetical protein